MKKITITIFAIVLSLVVFAQQNSTMVIHQGQNVVEFTITDADSIIIRRSPEKNVPPIIVITYVDTILFVDTMFYQPTGTVVDGRWLTSLGVVSFATDRTWTITGRRGFSQIWSDAVTASGCQKTTFNGGTQEGGVWTFYVDCRSNPGFPGDLFSWLAVYELRDELCPYPWRVPTAQDFMDLDHALGGNGRSRSVSPQFIVDNYINRWGGAFGGASDPTGMLSYQNRWGDYWSLSEGGINFGISLAFGHLGTVSPLDRDYKHDGLHLRCIR